MILSYGKNHVTNLADTSQYEEISKEYTNSKRYKDIRMDVLLFSGAGDEARTRYLHLGKVALYRMSYTRILVPPGGIEPTTRGFSVRCSTY